MMIPGSLSVTADGKNYCVMDEKIPGKEEMLWGFVMKRSSDWYVDGTFELVNSTLFQQVWVIVCPINENNTSILCAFFLLPSKEFQVYKMVLDCLKRLGINGPQKIHMDFEGEPIKAVKAVYPTTKINSCDFHWKQCLVRQLQKLGLMKSYNSHLEVQKSMMLQMKKRKLLQLDSTLPWDNLICISRIPGWDPRTTDTLNCQEDS
jgi:hypothetical protein